MISPDYILFATITSVNNKIKRQDEKKFLLMPQRLLQGKDENTKTKGKISTFTWDDPPPSRHPHHLHRLLWPVRVIFLVINVEV